MTNNPNNIRLGPCRVRWGGKDVGLTKGGVDVTLKTDTKQVQVDQFGLTPLDEFITGRTITVKCPFVENDIDSIYTLLKQAETNLVDNGGVIATGSITFSGMPAAADTLTVNGHVFTYSVTQSTPMPVDTIYVGTTVTQTIANTIATLNASSDPNVIVGVYTAAASAINVSYYKSGTVGNAFTLAKSSTTAIGTVTATLTGGINSISRRIEVMSGIGTSLRSNAQQLLLHPQNKADNDFTEDFVVPIAATNGGFTFKFELNNERVFSLDFTGYPDPVTTRLFLYGNVN